MSFFFAGMMPKDVSPSRRIPSVSEICKSARKALTVAAVFGVILGFSAAPVNAQISVDATTGSRETSNSDAIHTISGFTVAAGSNRKLVLCASWESGATSISATWNGTESFAVAVNTAAGRNSAILYLDDPTPGTGNIVVTFGVATGSGVGVMSLTGAANGVASVSSAAGLSGSLTTTEADTLVVGVYTSNGNIGTFTSPFSSPLYTGNTESSHGNAGYQNEATAGLKTYAWTDTTAANDNNALAGFAPAPVYTVTYNGNSNDGGSATVDSSSPYVDGATVTVLSESDLTRTDYVFTGWNTASDGSGADYVEGDTFTISSDTTLHAQWLPDTTTYTMTYNGNGNDGGSEPVDGSSPYTVGTMVTVLGEGTLTKTDYVFDGWNTASDGGGMDYAESDTLAITADTTLYAQCIPEPGGLINFDIDKIGEVDTMSGAAATGTPGHQWNSLATVSGAGSYHSGALMMVDADGNNLPGVSVDIPQVGSEPKFHTWGFNLSTPAAYRSLLKDYMSHDGTITVSGLNPGNYAVYIYSANFSSRSPQYNVNGVVSAEAAGANTGALQLNVNYVIAQNVTVSGAGTLVIAPQCPSCDVDYNISGFQIAATPTYTVTYNGNGSDGGSAPEDGSSPYVDGETVTVLGEGNLTKTDYVFTGWNTASDGSGTDYAEDDSFVIAGDTTLYAQWVPDVTTCTVIYNGNANDGGSAPVDGSSPYTVGAPVTVLGEGTLSKTDHVFGGWNTASDGSGTDYAEGNSFAITANTTLYAQWTPTYTVTYDGNGNDGGTAPVDGGSPYPDGATVTMPGGGDLTKMGYAFVGWNTASDGTGTEYAEGESFAISADTTLYARWRIPEPDGLINVDLVDDTGVNKYTGAAAGPGTEFATWNYVNGQSGETVPNLKDAMGQATSVSLNFQAGSAWKPWGGSGNYLIQDYSTQSATATFSGLSAGRCRVYVYGVGSTSSVYVNGQNIGQHNSANYNPAPDTFTLADTPDGTPGQYLMTDVRIAGGQNLVITIDPNTVGVSGFQLQSYSQPGTIFSFR